MNKIAGLALLVIAGIAVAMAQAPAPSAKGPSASQAVKQLEHDWIDAEKAGDADKLGEVLADEFFNALEPNPTSSIRPSNKDLRCCEL